MWKHCTGHNPYFNRWFSAIPHRWKISCGLKLCHNPYFNRWFSAIGLGQKKALKVESHNPYFNRWFSAIKVFKVEKGTH